MVRPFLKRFCTKYRTTPFGPAVFQASLYEISYNSIRSGRFPSDYVRNIVQLHVVRPFSKRFCTKYRTTPFGPAVFQAILYEISYNSIRSGRFSSDFVRNIVQLHSVRPFSKRLCTKYRTTLCERPIPRSSPSLCVNFLSQTMERSCQSCYITASLARYRYISGKPSIRSDHKSPSSRMRMTLYRSFYHLP